MKIYKRKNEKNKRGSDLGPTSQKILLLLLGGVVLGLNTNPGKYFKIVNAIVHDWKEINRRNLRRNIANLYRSQLVKTIRNEDGTLTLVLTQTGKERALTYQAYNLYVTHMSEWDRKWRIVLFDVPEKLRTVRDALRRALIRAGFFEYQKSVFIHPFECKDEVDFVIEFFRARPFTRFIVAESLDNEFHLKKHFNLE